MAEPFLQLGIPYRDRGDDAVRARVQFGRQPGGIGEVPVAQVGHVPEMALRDVAVNARNQLKTDGRDGVECADDAPRFLLHAGDYTKMLRLRCTKCTKTVARFALQIS